MSDNPVKDILHEAPHAPGCYLMSDEDDEVFYVGKAKDLHARMHQYINPGSDTRYFVLDLATYLRHVEFIITRTETEALILENSLIKKYRPRFNVRIKDDKTYFYLKIGENAPWPRLEVVRVRKEDKGVYFGPYASATAAREVLRLINKHFMLRDCTDRTLAATNRPCLRHEMGRCWAPCSKPVDEKQYALEVHRVRLFLEGRKDLLLQELLPAMKEASKNLDFETAAMIRDQIQAIDITLEKQFAEIPKAVDWDVIGFYREGEFAEACVVKVRNGRIDSRATTALRGYEVADADLMQSFLQQHYEENGCEASDIILPFKLQSSDALQQWLGDMAGRAVSTAVPQRGTKRQLLLLAKENAQKRFRQRGARLDDKLVTLEHLKRKLHLSRTPARIECADISNIQGSYAVGSVVCFIDGEPSKSDYRHYRIKLKDTPDDFAMMSEVLSRRFRRGKEEGTLPDLFMVDGGKGQLNIARAVLKELEIDQVALASLAKSRLKDSIGPAQIAKIEEGKYRTPERVFLPGRKNPVILKPGTGELELVVRLRDEAHRFAITYHRKLRKNATLKSGLLDIEGVGPKRMKALLSHFGSLKRIREAGWKKIAERPGFTKELAMRIADHLVNEPPAE